MVGWGTITIECNNEAKASKIVSKLREYDDVEYIEREGIMVRAVEGGYDNELISKGIELVHEGERFICLQANNTTDSGSGYMYEMKDGKVRKVDEKQGYEGCMSRDVYAYFLEQYDIKIKMR